MSSTPSQHNEAYGAKAELLSCAHGLLRKHRHVSRLTCLGDRCTLGMSALLTVVGVDVIWPTSNLVRVALSVLMLFIFLWVALGARGSRRARSMSLAQAVGMTETAAGHTHGQWRIAVELAVDAPAHDPLNELLRQRAFDSGLAAMRMFDVPTAVNISQARFALLRLCAITGVIALAAGLTPFIIGAEAPRFLLPTGDHPPYSGTRLALEVAPAEVRIGDDVIVTVEVTGKEVESLSLAIEDVDGESIDHIAMGRVHNDPGAGGTVFLVTLRDLRHPMRIHAFIPTSRSQRRLIAPVPKPRLRTASITIIPPSYTDRDALTLLLPTLEIPEVLAGSMIELRAACSIDIHHGDAPGSFMTTVDHATVAAKWRIDSAGDSSLTLNAVSAEGYGLDDPVTVTIRSVADLPPSIAIETPAAWRPDGQSAEVFASMGAGISVVAVARDDVRVQDVRVQWSADDPSSGGEGERSWTALPISVSAEQDGVRMHSVFSGQSVGKHPGESVWINVIARDNRPDAMGGAQRTIARPIQIHFVTSEQFGELAVKTENGTSEIIMQSDGVGLQSESVRGSSQPADQSSAGNDEQSDAGDGNTQSSGRPKTDTAAQPSSLSSGGSSNISSNGQLGATDSTERNSQDEARSPSSGVVRALRWGAGGAPKDSFTFKPDQLRALSERHRQLASRYYLLLNRRAAAGANHSESESPP